MDLVSIEFVCLIMGLLGFQTHQLEERELWLGVFILGLSDSIYLKVEDRKKGFLLDSCSTIEFFGATKCL